MMKDAELLALFEAKVAERGIHALTVDDQYLYEVLKNTKLSTCPMCGGELKHSIFSRCAGHGDFPLFLKIDCLNCSFDHNGCITYGETWQDVERAYLVRCGKVARCVAESIKNRK